MEVYIFSFERVPLILALYNFFYIRSKFRNSITDNAFILAPFISDEIISTFNFFKIFIFIILKTFCYSFARKNISHILKRRNFLIHDISTRSFREEIHSFCASYSFTIRTYRPSSEITYFAILIHKTIFCSFGLDSNIIDPYINILLSRTLKLFCP